MNWRRSETTWLLRKKNCWYGKFLHYLAGNCLKDTKISVLIFQMEAFFFPKFFLKTCVKTVLLNFVNKTMVLS